MICQNHTLMIDSIFVKRRRSESVRYFCVIPFLQNRLQFSTISIIFENKLCKRLENLLIVESYIFPKMGISL